jgi:hypothetical protein
VLGESVARVDAIELDHRAVTRHLRHDAGRHDRGTDLVAAHHRHLGQRRRRHVEGVDKQVLGLHAQAGHRARAGEVARLDQPESIDLRVVDGAHRDRDRAAPDDRVNLLALLGAEQLGVVQTRNSLADLQHDGAAHYRTRERAHAHLVHARDDVVAHCLCHALVVPEFRPHLFESSRRWCRPPEP